MIEGGCDLCQDSDRYLLAKKSRHFKIAENKWKAVSRLRSVFAESRWLVHGLGDEPRVGRERPENGD